MTKTIRLFAGAALLGSAAFAADSEGIKVGGFVDAQYNWVRQPSLKATNTFTIYDGAVYLGKSVGAGEVMIDIPFRSRTETELAAGRTATAAGQSGVANDSAFVVGAEKAQAYVAWKYENGFSWKVGQFDSVYGFEANDSADAVFAKQGLIWGNIPNASNPTLTLTVPTVHLGALMTYDLSELLGINLLVANPNPAGKMYDGNPDFGFKIVSKFDIFRASIGGLFTRVGNDKGTLFDVIAGAQFGKLMTDLEVTFDKAATAGSKTRFSGLVQLGYGLSDQLNVATRFEYSKLSTLKALAWTTGPQWWFSKGFVTKLDYTLSTVDGVNKTTSHAINLAAVQKF